MGFNVLWSLSQILNNSILEYVFCKGKLMGKGRTRQGAEAQAYTQSTLSHLPELGSQGPIPPPSRERIELKINCQSCQHDEAGIKIPKVWGLENSGLVNASI